MSLNSEKIFTTQLTNGVITITESMGVKKVSIYNGTATIGTFLGTGALGSLISTPVDIDQGETATPTVGEAGIISSLVITAPAGCTLKIMATQ